MTLSFILEIISSIFFLNPGSDNPNNIFILFAPCCFSINLISFLSKEKFLK